LTVGVRRVVVKSCANEKKKRVLASERQFRLIDGFSRATSYRFLRTPQGPPLFSEKTIEKENESETLKSPKALVVIWVNSFSFFLTLAHEGRSIVSEPRKSP
jgi:hypothetical protein